jgi:hypothetical protein
MVVDTMGATPGSFMSTAAAGGAFTISCDDPDCSASIISVLPGLTGIIPGGTPLRVSFAAQTRLPARLVGGEFPTTIVQPVETFDFSLRLFTPIVGRSLLLRAVGTATHSLDGPISGTTATFVAATSDGDTVDFSSDFLDFTGTVDRELVLDFAGISPSLAIDPTSGLLRSFDATLTHIRVDTNPLPEVIPLGAVPEPSAWVLAGLGLLTLAVTRPRCLRWVKRQRLPAQR